MMAVIVEIREMALTILCGTKNSFHSSPSNHNKELLKGHHSSRHKCPCITGTIKYFGNLLNIHHKAAEGCLALIKTPVDPRPVLNLEAGFETLLESECFMLMLKWAVKPLNLSKAVSC